MDSKDFDNLPHIEPLSGSGLQDKDLGTLFLLTSLSEKRGEVLYKQENHKHLLPSYFRPM